MTYEQIAHLLEKYWDGDTTLDEERALKNYFAQDAIDGRLRQHAPLFSALRAEQTVEYQRDGAIRVKMYATTSWHRWAAAAAVVGVLATAAWWALGRPAQTDISPVANVQPVAPAAPGAGASNSCTR